MGRRLIMNDGTIWEGSECGYAQGFLWLFLHGIGIREAEPVIRDPEATKRIIFEYGEMRDEYTGYITVKVIREEDYGCSVCLSRE